MMKYNILSDLILILLIMASCCHAADSKQRLDVKKHLKMTNKHALKSIKSPDGDIIDCVDIYKQPAFYHPSLKNHTLQMRPEFHPEEQSLSSEMPSLMSKKNDHKTITQLWHNSGRCPNGTVPIIRTTKDDVLIDSLIKSYGKKNFTNIPNAGNTGGHEYAIATIEGGKYFGTKATINLWKPQTQQSDEFSLSQIWLTSGPASSLNTIEAGWIVLKKLFRDVNPRLFIYWTRDGYKNTGCYNLRCSGFIQTNNIIALGSRINPISSYQGSQFEINILIWKDPNSGNWWLRYGNNILGYWPGSLFTYLQQSASTVQWGGEVVNTISDGHHTTTQMGSGHLPDEGYGKASFFKNIELVDGSNKLYIPPKLSAIADKPDCYNIQLRKRSENWGTYFYYGGPGRNPKCP